MRCVVAGSEQHARGAFDHAHDDAGSHAVAGDVGDVGDPFVGVAGEIDQVAADFAAGRRAAVKFPCTEARLDRRDENAVDLGGEFDFGLHAEVAAALPDIDEQEADVADDRGADDGPAVDSEAPLLSRDRDGIHLRRFGQSTEILADQTAYEELRGEYRKNAIQNFSPQRKTGKG